MVYLPLCFQLYRIHGSRLCLAFVLLCLCLGFFTSQETLPILWESLVILSPITLASVWLTHLNGEHQNNASKKSNVAFKSIIRVSCHDISNYLTIIFGAAQIAESGAFDKRPEKLKELWPKILRSSEKINRVLMGLRSFESIQDPPRLSIDAIKIDELMVQLQKSYKQLAEKQGLYINFSLQKQVDSFDCDLVLLRQACLNIIMENAIHFAKEASTIDVQINLEQDRFTFKVSNESEKIPDEIMEKIFQFDFVSPGPSPSKTKGAGGFSISICKLVAEYWLGSFNVCQVEGKGGRYVTNALLVLPIDN